MTPPRTYVLRSLAGGLDPNWVCPDCGVVVFDRDQHDYWHASIEEFPEEEP